MIRVSDRPSIEPPYNPVFETNQPAETVHRRLQAAAGDLLRLAERLEELPQIRESVARGDLGYTKARELVKVASHATRTPGSPRPSSRLAASWIARWPRPGSRRRRGGTVGRRRGVSWTVPTVVPTISRRTSRDMPISPPRSPRRSPCV